MVSKCSTKQRLLMGLIVVFSMAPVFVQAEETDIEPLALQKIMSDMGENMQAITAGISAENWQQVEKNAVLIADHPQPPIIDKVRIMSFIGMQMGAFKELDGKTHEAARKLAKTVNSQNGYEIIAAFSELQNTCMACHVKFRQSYVKHFYPATEK